MPHPNDRQPDGRQSDGRRSNRRQSDGRQSDPERGSGLDIFVRRAGRFLAVFFSLWIVLAGLLTYARIVTAENPPLSWPEIVIIVIIAAAVTVGIAFPIAVGIVEGIPMVLAKLFLDRVRDESKEIGREEGVEIGVERGVEIGREEGVEIGIARGLRQGDLRTQARWREWNDRRKQAERAGQPFTEPEPELDDDATLL